MADRTLTINHADGGSETYTINRDKFAGVRDMVVDGADVSVDHTAVPKEQSKETTFGGSQSITVNRDIEPLLSKVVGGAAAAYSLRDLNDSQGNNNVVRVRRDSDNSEKDFKAKEVSNGTMARWVNEQPTLPLDLRELDTNTGERDGALIEAAAAYSLRKLNASGTDVTTSGDTAGDTTGKYVVQVRRSSDDAVKSFTASEVADGTLEAWVGSGNDGHVRTWYDQSGSDNHAVQTTAAKQPKIVDGGNLLEDGNLNPSIKFTTADATFMTASGVSITQPYSFFLKVQADKTATEQQLIDSVSTNPAFVQIVTDGRLLYNNGSAIYTSTDLDNIDADFIHSGFINGSSTDAFTNGASALTDTDVGSNGLSGLTIGKHRTLSSNYFDGQFSELIIYNSDQSANRTAIEANIGETYGITAIPAANDTVNGYVQTWYDQSGSGNDAEQSAASSQPKIVGEVTSGQPHAFLGALVFDGSQQFQTITLTSSAQPNSIFSVSNTSVAGQTRGIYGTNFSQAGYYRSSNKHAIYSSGTGAGTLEGSAYVVDTDYLRFDLFNGANSVLGVNGTTTSGSTGDAVINRLDIGDASLGGVNPLNGGIKELILYTDDQSPNRPAIETNIANQYGITLS